MKREFKKGDRVLVRLHDLDEWKAKEFKSINLANPLYTFVDTDDDIWSQCRHIDDFRTGDKVQAQYDYGDEWHDAVYACALPQSNHWPHQVYNKAQSDTFAAKFVRWHPSVPWAQKEEIIDEPHWVRAIFRHLDAIEAKLNEK